MAARRLDSGAFRAVFDRGREKGVLSPGEVSELLQDAEVSPEDLEGLYSRLSDVGIEVVEPGAEDEEDYAEEARFLSKLDLTLDQTPGIRYGCTSRRSARFPCSAPRKKWNWPRRSGSRTLKPSAGSRRPIYGLWCLSPSGMWGAVSCCWI